MSALSIAEINRRHQKLQNERSILEAAADALLERMKREVRALVDSGEDLSQYSFDLIPPAKSAPVSAPAAPVGGKTEAAETASKAAPKRTSKTKSD